MRKAMFATGVLALGATAIYGQFKSGCSGPECGAMGSMAVENRVEPPLVIAGLPEPLTEIQLLSTPLLLEEPAPNPRAQLLLPVPAVMQADILENLQGKWVSARNAEDRFTVTGTSRQSVYSGARPDPERIGVAWRCGHYSGGGSYLRAQAEGGEELCYTIDSITADELVMTYLPTGDRLRFLREAE